MTLTGNQYIFYHECSLQIQKLRVFQQNILNNILFLNKLLFRLKKVESLLRSFCKPEDKSYIDLFYRCRETSIICRQTQEFLSTTLYLPSILSQSAIFRFLDDASEHKLLLKCILRIFKSYLYKARENKSLNLNILKSYLRGSQRS